MEPANPPRSGRLEGLACLIVGGTGGIGLAAARRFLNEGARLIVAGEASGAGAIEREGLEKLGPIREFTVDLASETEVVGFFEAARDALGGRLDLLLHVAGISGRRFGDGLLHECTIEGWERTLEVNARGVFLTNREALRIMLGQERDRHGLRGSVVNVGSVLDRSPAPRHFGTIAYAASKGAVRALTLSAAAAYAAEGVRFNLLEPGLIDTPMAARAVRNAELRPYIQRKQPLAAGPLAANDVAEAALALAEPATRFVTGAVLTVDGGWAVSEGGP